MPTPGGQHKQIFVSFFSFFITIKETHSSHTHHYIYMYTTPLWIGTDARALMHTRVLVSLGHDVFRRRSWTKTVDAKGQQGGREIKAQAKAFVKKKMGWSFLLFCVQSRLVSFVCSLLSFRISPTRGCCLALFCHLLSLLV